MRGKGNKKTPKRPLAETLMWLSIMTRPDIANAVRACARLSHNPSPKHWKLLSVIDPLDYGSSYQVRYSLAQFHVLPVSSSYTFVVVRDAAITCPTWCYRHVQEGVYVCPMLSIVIPNILCKYLVLTVVAVSVEHLFNPTPVHCLLGRCSYHRDWRFEGCLNYLDTTLWFSMYPYMIRSSIAWWTRCY